MKNIRLAAVVIFAVWAFSVSAQAQKKWTYKGDDGSGGVLTIIVTQRPDGYEVTGDYTYKDDTCQLRGSYLPAGQRLRATCVAFGRSGDQLLADVTGSKQSGKDAFQVHMGRRGENHIGFEGELVAKRVGAKPATTGVSAESSSSSAAPSVVGTWTWAYAETGDPQKHGTVTFKADPMDTAKGTMEWSGGSKGTWTQNGDTVELDWGKKTINGVKIKDTMALLDGGKKLKGTNSLQWPVVGTRP